jgi:hypothetical protein
MDDVPAFTKMTGLMGLNDIANKVKLSHPPNIEVAGEISYAIICALPSRQKLGKSLNVK